MKIEGTPKEIADFVLEVQNRLEENTQCEKITSDVVSGRAI